MISDYFQKVISTLIAINQDDIFVVTKLLAEVKTNNARVFIFGNGGSSATASHFAQDLNKMLNFDAICLSDNTPSVLAYGNDVSFDSIFELQLKRIMSPQDLIIGISCSGNSQNVLNAIMYADSLGNNTIGFTGYHGGKLKRLAKHEIHVPCDDMQVCEDCHLVIMHNIIRTLK